MCVCVCLCVGGVICVLYTQYIFINERGLCATMAWQLLSEQDGLFLSPVLFV